ncbi:MAG: HAMP domain-containing sensor histidine kinase [Oligoflexales bacterium]
MRPRLRTALKRFIVKSLLFATHPIVVFVVLQIVWVAITILWVSWFVDQKESFTEMARHLGRTTDTTYGLVFLVAGVILLAVILIGTVLLFIFAQRQASLIRQQRNFVSSVTHELRSPLASIQLSIETLQRENVPKPVIEQLFSMVGKDIERLSRLVDQILVSARLDRGLIDVSEATKEEIYLVDILRKTVEESVHRDPKVQERVSIECPPELMLDTVPLAINLILGNLLENAMNYSPRSTPISIAVTEKDNEVTIGVRDQGFGIEKKDLRKVFKMFHRTKTSTKKAIPGTGLGLYIVKSTVKTLGGKVWAESNGPGQGSVFYVQLPRTRSARI